MRIYLSLILFWMQIKSPQCISDRRKSILNIAYCLWSIGWNRWDFDVNLRISSFLEFSSFHKLLPLYFCFFFIFSSGFSCSCLTNFSAFSEKTYEMSSQVSYTELDLLYETFSSEFWGVKVPVRILSYNYDNYNNLSIEAEVWQK